MNQAINLDNLAVKKEGLVRPMGRQGLMMIMMMMIMMMMTMTTMMMMMMV